MSKSVDPGQMALIQQVVNSTIFRFLDKYGKKLGVTIFLVNTVGEAKFVLQIS